MSAQLLFDALGAAALDTTSVPEPAPGLTLPALAPQLLEAHSATGWDVVAQQYGLTGQGQTVAVIDSGVAWDHQALGSGFGPGHRVVGGWDFAENDADPYDDGPAGFHGTHVSGIIASNDPQHPGVAPGVDLVALRVFNDMGQGNLTWLESALRWVHENRNAFQHPITTVNMSLGTVWNSDTVPAWGNLEDELQLLANDGIVVVAAAGNSFAQYQTPGLSYPAASPYVLPVASLDEDGTISDFSQRNHRVLAAPGTNIVSTVPDGFFGRDGIANDFAAASGTSMAAPYVAGATVLVRQAMEMAGWDQISPQTIIDYLHQTAGKVYDSVTGWQYDTLDLQSAIDGIIPADDVGNTVADATALSDLSTTTRTWINHMGDVDAYTLTPSRDGQLTVELNSDWAEGLSWTLLSDDRSVVASSGGGAMPVTLHESSQYTLLVTADTIGPVDINLDFVPATSDSIGAIAWDQTTDLGAVHFSQVNLAAGQVYAVTATGDGLFTIAWDASSGDHAAASLLVRDASGNVVEVAPDADGTVRWDGQVQVGDRIEFALPGEGNLVAQLTLANVVSVDNGHAMVRGTENADILALDIGSDPSVSINGLRYDLAELGVNRLFVDGGVGNDELKVVGSTASDIVYLRPQTSTLESPYLQVETIGIEQVAFTGNGGPDRVYLYDSDSDDTLNIAPGQAALVGAGYRFDVNDVNRIFVHATGAGEDIAFFADSPGDDVFSARPQFSSMRGDGYFNYVRGFERVYAYATHGGTDTVQFSDSPNDDRFFTSGTTASMVGPGFASFSRGFDNVFAQGGSGGHDTAALYGSSGRSAWYEGSDFVSFRQDGYIREARRFDEVARYVDGQLQSTYDASGNFTVKSMPADATSPPAGELGAATVARESAAATVDTATPSVAATSIPATTPGTTNIAMNIYDTLPASLLNPTKPLHQTPGALVQQLGATDPMVTPEGPEPLIMDREHPDSLARAQHGAAMNELELLRDVETMHDWIADALSLPEESLLNESQLERAILDQAFGELAGGGAES